MRISDWSSDVCSSDLNATTAAWNAAEVGISDVHAEVTPAGKLDVIRQLQDDGHVVAMVGDGVNDAAALAAADLGQIGSASCRERVCQYVSMSVIALSLKKKQQHNM